MSEHAEIEHARQSAVDFITAMQPTHSVEVLMAALILHRTVEDLTTAKTLGIAVAASDVIATGIADGSRAQG